MIPDNLTTERLRLRSFLATDSPAVFNYWQSDPGWERFNASVPANFTESDAEQFVSEMIARDHAHRPNWAITYEGAVVGIVSLTFEQNHRIAVIGYGVHADIRGRGLVVEAASEVVGEAFTAHPDLTRLRAHTNAENKASMRVLEKLGFQREGILRKNQFVKGHFSDEAIYGLLREEWRGA